MINQKTIEMSHATLNHIVVEIAMLMALDEENLEKNFKK